MLHEILQDIAGPDYAVLAREPFRVGIDTVVTPDLAVVADAAYQREQVFRPHHGEGLNVVPVLALIVDFAPGSEAEELGRTRPYFARGTRVVCFASPDLNSLVCYSVDGDCIRGDLSNMETVLRPLGAFSQLWA